MPTAIRIALVALPLTLVACKKKGGEIETPVTEPAPPPAPALDWSFGPARYLDGSGGVGNLTIPVKITVNNGEPLIVRSWSVGVDTEGGRVCVASAEEIEKTATGTLEFDMKTECEGAKLPDAEKVKLIGNIRYTLGGVDDKHGVDARVTLSK